METTIGSSYREVQETEGSRSRDSTVQRCRSKTPAFLFMRILINRTWAFFASSILISNKEPAKAVPVRGFPVQYLLDKER